MSNQLEMSRGCGEGIIDGGVNGIAPIGWLSWRSNRRASAGRANPKGFSNSGHGFSLSNLRDKELP